MQSPSLFQHDCWSRSDIKIFVYIQGWKTGSNNVNPGSAKEINQRSRWQKERGVGGVLANMLSNMINNRCIKNVSSLPNSDGQVRGRREGEKNLKTLIRFKYITWIKVIGTYTSYKYKIILHITQILLIVISLDCNEVIRVQWAHRTNINRAQKSLH